MTKQTKKQRIRIMVASSVYGFEDTLTQICAMLTGFGYEVLNSHYGSIRVGFHKSNLEACLDAVESCDIFLGIIRPYYGSGIIEKDEPSITHQEMKRAVALDKPRLFLAHRDVTFSRQLLKPYLGFWKNNTNSDFKFTKTKVFDDLRILEMYDDACNSQTPIANRKDHWVQEFYQLPELLRFVESNFGDIKRVREDLEL